MTRIPCQGEFVNLGNDKAGISADYEVVLVHHCPFRPHGVDAEIFLRRVDFTAVITDAHERDLDHPVTSSEPPESWGVEDG